MSFQCHSVEKTETTASHLPAVRCSIQVDIYPSWLWDTRRPAPPACASVIPTLEVRVPDRSRRWDYMRCMLWVHYISASACKQQEVYNVIVGKTLKLHSYIGIIYFFAKYKQIVNLLGWISCLWHLEQWSLIIVVRLNVFASSPTHARLYMRNSYPRPPSSANILCVGKERWRSFRISVSCFGVIGCFKYS